MESPTEGRIYLWLLPVCLLHTLPGLLAPASHWVQSCNVWPLDTRVALKRRLGQDNSPPGPPRPAPPLLLLRWQALARMLDDIIGKTTAMPGVHVSAPLSILRSSFCCSTVPCMGPCSEGHGLPAPAHCKHCPVASQMAHTFALPGSSSAMHTCIYAYMHMPPCCAPFLPGPRPHPLCPPAPQVPTVPRQLLAAPGALLVTERDWRGTARPEPFYQYMRRKLVGWVWGLCMSPGEVSSRLPCALLPARCCCWRG